MGALDKTNGGKTVKTTGVYSDSGMTCLPNDVMEALGGIDKDDGLVWTIDEETGEVKVDKNGSADL